MLCDLLTVYSETLYPHVQTKPVTSSLMWFVCCLKIDVKHNWRCVLLSLLTKK